MPRSAWGSLTRVARGHYRLRYWGDAHDGRGYRRISEEVYGTRRDAEYVRSLRRVEHDADTASVDPTVAQAHDTWWVEWADRRCAEGTMSRNTRRQRDSAWRAHVGPRWGSCRLSEVTPAALEDWMRGMSRPVAVGCRTLLSSIYDRAALHGWEGQSPTRAALDMPRDRPREHDSYTTGDLAAAWGALRGMPCEAAFLLMAFGGLRVGESLAVMVGDVVCGECGGVDVATVRVLRTVGARDGSVGPDGALKTPQSVRVAAVAGAPARRLREIAEARRDSGVAWLSCEGAECMGTSRLIRVWRRAVEGAGLRYLPPQTLRPSWRTTMAYTLGLDASVAERLMGHLMPGVTGRHYDRPHVADLVVPLAQAYVEHPYMG